MPSAALLNISLPATVTNDSDWGCNEVWSDLEAFRDILGSNYFALKIILLASYVSVSVVGAVGNALVILAVVHNPLMRTPRNFFIINLAISDFLMCTVTAPFTLKISILDSFWDLGETSCKVVSSLLGANCFVSNLSVIAIGLDRYLVVLFPTNRGLQRLAIFSCFIAVWLASVSLALPLYFSNQLTKLSAADLDLCGFHIYQCGENLRSYFSTHFKGVYYVGCFILLYLIPLCTLGFFYGKILFRLKRRPNTQRNQPKRNADSTSTTATNLHKLLVSIVVVYGVCWLPLTILNVFSSLGFSASKESAYNTVIFAGCHMIGMMSSCANPILYGVLNPNFRNEYRVIAHKLICRCCTSVDNSHTTAANVNVIEIPERGVLLPGNEIKMVVDTEAT